jgi:hypothetical protein
MKESDFILRSNRSLFNTQNSTKVKVTSVLQGSRVVCLDRFCRNSQDFLPTCVVFEEEEETRVGISHLSLATVNVLSSDAIHHIFC